MNVAIILGSRNQTGQTTKATEAFEEGLKSAGNQCDQIFLPQLKIERCRQCDDNGWGICRTQGQCVIEDDFQGIVEKIEKSDAVVFATPVYFSDLSESMRAFLDRLRRTCMHESGKKRISEKMAIGICVAGGGGGGAPTCTVSLEKVLNTCGFNILDLIPMRRQNTDLKLAVLNTTGKWLAKYIPPK
jgi:multimeric flavodoxin WrbA